MDIITSIEHGIFDEHDEQLLDHFLTARNAFRSPDQCREVDRNVFCIFSYHLLQDVFVKCVRCARLDISNGPQILLRPAIALKVLRRSPSL